MLIDNKQDRYPDDGFDIKTVWDFINKFSGKKSEQTGNIDIMKKKRNISSSSYPAPDGHPTRHRPRRNYWGNLYDEDTFDEDRHNFTADSDTALYDSEVGCSI